MGTAVHFKRKGSDPAIHKTWHDRAHLRHNPCTYVNAVIIQFISNAFISGRYDLAKKEQITIGPFLKQISSHRTPVIGSEATPVKKFSPAGMLFRPMSSTFPDNRKHA